MLRIVACIIITLYAIGAQAQAVLTKERAVELALANQRNLAAAKLSVKQQQQLLRATPALDNPQVSLEASPYEPLIVGVQQSFSLPGVYRNRRALQSERIRLAQLQLQGSQYDLKREVRTSYLQLQYLVERVRLLAFQDSVYSAIKASSVRFFKAGQINKLEELTATTQADKVRNELERGLADLDAEKQVFRFYTAYTDSFIVASLQDYDLVVHADTLVNTIQQQLLEQQVLISQRELRAERAELLPQLNAGVLLPTNAEYERAVGYQVGVALPIWRRQNRARIMAAQTGVQIAQAQQELEQQRLQTQYRQAVTNYNRELRSLSYYNTTALPQSRAIIETSQRLFQGGELNYIESLRNLITAFEIQMAYLETHRAMNAAVIEINYLNGTL